MLSFFFFFFLFLFLVFDFRFKFFNNFKKNYYCDEGLLVSKKVTSVISSNVKLWSDMILVVLTMTIELLILRKKIGYTECDKSTDRSNVGTA